MNSSALKYKKICHALRFSRDQKINSKSELILNENKLLNDRLRNGLLIHEYSTPVLDAAIKKVCVRLGFLRQNIEAFTYASPDIQATCISITHEKCVIQISSSLANILNEDELVFIFGHELAHHIFQHWKSFDNTSGLERSIQQRAQEISVDRVGLYCCNSLKTAMTAIIKTISGLDENHLQFNVGQFVSQLSYAGKSGFYEDIESSHPSFLFRAKALLLFFDQQLFDQLNDFNFDNTDLAEKNIRVERELDKLIEAPLIMLKESLLAEYSMWSTINSNLLDGTFKKAEQLSFKEKFGEENLEKFLRLLKNKAKPEVLKVIEQNLKKAEEELINIFPEYSQQYIEK